MPQNEKTIARNRLFIWLCNNTIPGAEPYSATLESLVDAITDKPDEIISLIQTIKKEKTNEN